MSEQATRDSLMRVFGGSRRYRRWSATPPVRVVDTKGTRDLAYIGWIYDTDVKQVTRWISIQQWRHFYREIP